MNANDIIDEAFDEFANQFDHESNEWLDMDVQMIFAAGWKAALKSSLPAESEVELAAQDASLGGTAFMQDGKRIDPAEVYSLPAETVSEAMVEEALTVLLNRISKNDFRIKTEDMCAALEAAALAHADDGWRPIEDGVPKDGTGILVWIKGAELPFTARWSVARNRWVDMQNDESVYTSPTHWRPLPPLPKDGRK